MGKFVTGLDVRKLDEHSWQLLGPFVYESDTVGTIIVPKGFITNFGSVPRLPFMYAAFGGVGDQACTLHDWLYEAPHETYVKKIKILLKYLMTIMRGYYDDR